MINLGDEVKEIVSGFSGIATGRTEYIAGCIQILVCPKTLTKDGELKKGKWFDEGLLEVIKRKSVNTDKVKTKKAKTKEETVIGGPREGLNPMPRS